MVLKFEEQPEEVFFLEATSNNGVSLRRWSNIKPFLGTFYTKVVHRHVDWDRTEKSLQNLEIFMKEVVGNSYKFSMKQLIKRNTISPKLNKFEIQSLSQSEEYGTIIDEQPENVRLVEEGRAFFCSELVAKCWKVCGLMKPTDQASSNFLPSHFTSQKQTIVMEDDVDL